MGKSGRFGRVNPAKDVHFARANQAKNVHFGRVGKPSQKCPFWPRGQTQQKLSILAETIYTSWPVNTQHKISHSSWDYLHKTRNNIGTSVDIAVDRH